MPLSDQDLLTGDEIDAFLRAENGKKEEKESAEAYRGQRWLEFLPTLGREITRVNPRNLLDLSGIRDSPLRLYWNTVCCLVDTHQNLV